MGVSSCSKEVLGGSLLKKIEHENHVLLFESLDADHLVVLVVEKETYTIRKKFKQFVEDMQAMKIYQFFETGILFSENDPQYQIMETKVKEIFIEPDEDNVIEENDVTEENEVTEENNVTDENNESKELDKSED